MWNNKTAQQILDDISSITQIPKGHLTGPGGGGRGGGSGQLVTLPGMGGGTFQVIGGGGRGGSSHEDYEQVVFHTDEIMPDDYVFTPDGVEFRVTELKLQDGMECARCVDKHGYVDIWLPCETLVKSDQPNRLANDLNELGREFRTLGRNAGKSAAAIQQLMQQQLYEQLTKLGPITYDDKGVELINDEIDKVWQDYKIQPDQMLVDVGKYVSIGYDLAEGPDNLSVVSAGKPMLLTSPSTPDHVNCRCLTDAVKAAAPKLPKFISAVLQRIA